MDMLLAILNIFAGLILCVSFLDAVPSLQKFAKWLGGFDTIIGIILIIVVIWKGWFDIFGIIAIFAGLIMMIGILPAIPAIGKNLEKFALDLARVGVDYMYLGGTALFTYKGVGSDLEVIERIESLTGIPATTSVTAEIEALRKLNIKKIVHISPHRDEVILKTKTFLNASGFEVLNSSGLQIRENAEFAKIPAFEVYRFAKKSLRSWFHQ